MVWRGFVFLFGRSGSRRCGLAVAQRRVGRCNLFEPQFLVAVEYLYGAVEQAAYGDSLAWSWHGLVALEYLVEALLAAEGPVVGDCCGLLETEYLAQFELLRHRTVKIRLALWLAGAFVV